MLDDETTTSSSTTKNEDANNDTEDYLSANEDTYVQKTRTKIRHTLSLSKEVILPLATDWTFWLDVQNQQKTASGFVTKSEDYEEGLNVIYHVNTVQEFWSVFNNIPSPGKLAPRISYSLMRQSRKPLWEDEENINGGICTLKCPKPFTNDVWTELCLATIGEQFDIENDDVVGITVQARDGPCDVIQIWNTNPGEQAQKSIFEKVTQLFPGVNFPVKFYKANKSHDAFATAGQQQQQQQKT